MHSIQSIVQVAVGVVIRAGQVFLTKRHPDAHQGGKWEFPGGKVEQGETIAQALARELQEEIAISVLAVQPFMVIEHDYGDKIVKLDIFVVEHFSGEPRAQEGQGQQWFSFDELSTLDFPQANRAIVARLQQEFINIAH